MSQKHKEAIHQDQGIDAIGSREAPVMMMSVDTVMAEGTSSLSPAVVKMVENGAAVPDAYCDMWRFTGGQLAELWAFMVRLDDGSRKD